jgi:sterol desaturase/sphingolipid hydroxylase (fatty acid hydroxylase superfamily)
MCQQLDGEEIENGHSSSSSHFTNWCTMMYSKRYHMQHHYKTPDERFGVSSPLWDMVFGTKPA